MTDWKNTSVLCQLESSSSTLCTSVLESNWTPPPLTSHNPMHKSKLLGRNSSNQSRPVQKKTPCSKKTRGKEMFGVHASSRNDVNRNDTKKMKVFEKKATEKQQLLDIFQRRHLQRYGISRDQTGKIRLENRLG
ncbi:unnamed protein product [Caenorhabditis brenneri]